MKERPATTQKPQEEGTRASKRIVVGVDASAHAREALRWAISFAQPGDTINLVHAWNLYAIGGLEAPNLNPSTFEVAANRLLDDVVNDVFSGDERNDFEIETTAVHGHAAEALIDASNGADLLVVGRRGLGGFRAMLLGSVSGDVIHHAQCPVVVTPVAEE